MPGKKTCRPHQQHVANESYVEQFSAGNTCKLVAIVNIAGDTLLQLEATSALSVKDVILRTKPSLGGRLCSLVLEERELQASCTVADCGIQAGDVVTAIVLAGARMKAAGITVELLRGSNYTARELRDAGYTASEVKAAGHDLRELGEAGYTAMELKTCFKLKQLATAGHAQGLLAGGYTIPDLLNAGCALSQIRDAGYSVQDLRALWYTTRFVVHDRDIHDAGYTATEFAAGYTQGGRGWDGLNYIGRKAFIVDAKLAGYTVAEIREVREGGVPIEIFRDAGFTASELRNSGCSLQELCRCGFLSRELRVAGWTVADLKREGHLR